MFVLIKKVLKTIKENNMFDKGDRVIVAVSGGPDSIALVHILHSLKEELQIKISVAHVNHCLRGKEANEDEDYVKRFCENYKIEFRSKRVDINKLSKLKNMSSESAGREARYGFFENLREETNANKIAIAHNANDQAETILMRIIRGTGIEGLVGIKPVRDTVFVRPLINIMRNEIEEYCAKNNLNPRIDKTNLETIYARNKVRLELIPYIEENFNKDIIKGLNRFSNTMKIDSEYLELIGKEKYKKYCDINKEKVIISKEAFLEHESIISRVIRLALHKVCGNLYDFERIHIYDVMDIQKNSTGKQLNLPNNISVLNSYGDIIINKIRKENIETNNKEFILRCGINEVRDMNLRAYLKLVDAKENIEIKRKRLVKYFDYDKIKGNVVLRYRKDGDRFRPLGMTGSKKIKDLFIDLKVSKDKRDIIPLVCFNGEIGWIVGYRESELFKVDENTKRILEVRIESEDL